MSKTKGSNYHPSRTSGEQKRIRERAVNENTIKDRGRIKDEDLYDFPNSKKKTKQNLATGGS